MHRKKQAGFGLVEALVMASVMAIVSLGSLAILKNFVSGVRSGAVAAQTDTIFTTISRAAALPANLKWTAENFPDTDFGRCVNGGGSCAADVEYPVDLFAAPPADNVEQGARHLAGSLEMPRRFSADGAPCSTAGPACPLRAHATFQAVCKESSPCPQAIAVRLTITVEQEPGARAAGRSFPLRRRQTMPPIEVAVRDIATIGGGEPVKCPAGHVAKGFDVAKNLPVCEAAGVYVANGGIAYAQNPDDPCTNLENHDSTGFFRQHWTGVAKCLDGDIVTGGGGYCQGLQGGSMLDSRPLGANAGWFIDCCLYNDGTLPNPLPGTVYALCLHMP